MAAPLVAAAVAGPAIGGVAGYFASREQNKANAAAIRAQERFTKESQKKAIKGVATSFGKARDEIRENQANIDALAGAQAGTIAEFGRRQGLAEGTLSGSLGQARTDLQAGIGGASGILAELAAQDPYSGFQESEGYRFRQQQGERAINQLNAAQGGRAGGNALKELAEFNQGLASQEYDKFIQQRMGMNAQAQNLAGMRAQQAFSGGQALGGQSLAGGGALSGLIASNAAGFAGTGLGAEQFRFGAQSAQASNLSGLYAQQGGLKAGIYTGAQSPNFLGAAQGAGAGYSAIGQAVGQAGSNLTFLSLLGNQGGGGFGQNWADQGNAMYNTGAGGY